MKNCLCGASIQPNSKFCEKCGIKLSEEPVLVKANTESNITKNKTEKEILRSKFISMAYRGGQGG